MGQAWIALAIVVGLAGCGRDEPAKTTARDMAPPASATDLEVVKMRAEAWALFDGEKLLPATADRLARRAKIQGDLAAADAAVEARQSKAALPFLKSAVAELRALSATPPPTVPAAPNTAPTPPAAGIPGA
jgi:hypothetical protein